MGKQVWLRETGPADVLKIENVPTPEPQAGEVRIWVKAIGLNRAEVNLRAGKPSKLPLPIGLEAAGTIDAIGTGVANLKVGDAVSVAPAFLMEDREVILFKNAGIGNSSGEVPTSIPQMGANAIAFIRALGLAIVDVLGFSIGGMVAQEIAIQAPDLVRLCRNFGLRAARYS
jgi:NADPH:quinone reductase-like Zn-dependent oxidoreductase